MGRSLIVPVWDVGPYATNDDFWNPQRRGFPDLPVGWPQDHAAYFEGYNDRQAELGDRRFLRTLCASSFLTVLACAAAQKS